eukprot:2237131-Pyramimonas_sp.AAC.1
MVEEHCRPRKAAHALSPAPLGLRDDPRPLQVATLSAMAAPFAWRRWLAVSPSSSWTLKAGPTLRPAAFLQCRHPGLRRGNFGLC